jgi:hypothetical protein
VSFESEARPNRRVHIETLRRMTPERRLAKAFELSDMTREALRAGLAQRYPDATPQELTAMVIERLGRCRERAGWGDEHGIARALAEARQLAQE